MRIYNDDLSEDITDDVSGDVELSNIIIAALLGFMFLLISFIGDDDDTKNLFPMLVKAAPIVYETKPEEENVLVLIVSKDERIFSTKGVELELDRIELTPEQNLQLGIEPGLELSKAETIGWKVLANNKHDGIHRMVPTLGTIHNQNFLALIKKWVHRGGII